MSSSYLPAALRRQVARRARHLCEYCLIAEADSFYGCEVDHIISEKHGGPTALDNLAYACVFCKRNKGSDIGSIVWETGTFTRFFNPRLDRWSDHFGLDGSLIKPQTDIGIVTVEILKLNSTDRLLERQALRRLGRYPSPEAIHYITTS